MNYTLRTVIEVEKRLLDLYLKYSHTGITYNNFIRALVTGQLRIKNDTVFADPKALT